MREGQRAVLADGERSGGTEVETDGDGELQTDLSEGRGLIGKGLRGRTGTGEAQDRAVFRISYRTELQGEDAGGAAQQVCAAERFGHVGSEENGHIHRQRSLLSDGDALGAESGDPRGAACGSNAIWSFGRRKSPTLPLRRNGGRSLRGNISGAGVP